LRHTRKCRGVTSGSAGYDIQITDWSCCAATGQRATPAPPRACFTSAQLGSACLAERSLVDTVLLVHLAAHHADASVHWTVVLGSPAQLTPGVAVASPRVVQ